MANYDFTLAAGDLLPIVERTLYLPGGAVADLTGVTVEFRWKRVGSSGNAQVRTATIVAATRGRVRYEWVLGDTDVAGEYDYKFRGFWDGKPMSFPSASHGRFLIGPSL